MLVQRANQLRLVCHLNLAQCFLKASHRLAVSRSRNGVGPVGYVLVSVTGGSETDCR